MIADKLHANLASRHESIGRPWRSLAHLLPLLIVGTTLIAADLKPVTPLTVSVTAAIGNVRLANIPLNALNGMRLTLTDVNGEKAVIFLKNGDVTVWTTTKTATAKETKTPVTNFAKRAFPQIAAASSVDLTFKLRKRYWALWIDQTMVLKTPTLLGHPISFQVDAPSLPEPPPQPRFQKTGDLYFNDDFMVEAEVENPLCDWEALSGEWRIHTALADAIEQESSKRLDARPLDAEHSPNFYCVKGKGTPGLLVTGHPFHDDYSLRASIQLKPGEAGVAFYVRGINDYHTFSIILSENSVDQPLAVLKRHRDGHVQTLQAVSVPYYQEQWVELKVEAFENTINAFIDATNVINVHTPLPHGGRFGLFIDTNEEIRFDDVRAKSIQHIPLTHASDVKGQALTSHGDVFPSPGIFDWIFQDAEERERLFPGVRSNDRWIVLGRKDDRDGRFSAVFHPDDEPFDVGLVLGWTCQNEPCLQFHCEREGDKLFFTLTNGALGERKTAKLLTFAKIAATGDSDEPFTLSADISDGDFIRCYLNGKLSLFHKANAPVVGGYGVLVGRDSDASVSNVHLTFEKIDPPRDSHEDNEIFLNDPFMRHWSSPAGQWIRPPSPPADAKKEATPENAATALTWHKSDFFGNFALTLPLAAPATINLGVADQAKEGAVKVTITQKTFEVENRVTGETIVKKPLVEIFKGLDPTTYFKPKEEKVAKSAPEETPEKPSPSFTLHKEDDWIWGESGGAIFFKHFLTTPFTGTRINVTGFDAEALAASRAVRDNVKDFLFTESPHEWFNKGGRWQIINRFKCDPRWSHLNGESADALADLWAKYLVEGDFCLEMYAGMRHGWYARVGDINLTVMNKEKNIGDGYTFICSGWDANHSQMTSRFLRNGEPVATSDKYLTPRFRAGNKRHFFNPLINRGRDVHGAWYYFKIRRIGSKIEYYFDNELVFSQDDPAPLDDGGFGVWTYLNSIMIARVKIAAEKLTREPVRFHKVNAAAIPDNAPSAAIIKDVEPIKAEPNTHSNAEPSADITKSAKPLINDVAFSKLYPSWSVPIDAGRNSLERLVDSTGESLVKTVKRFRGGVFPLMADQTIPASSIAGWRFNVIRTPEAMFNFHFELGVMDGNGKYHPRRHFFHHLSGSDYDQDVYELIGDTPIPVSTRNQFKENQGAWTPVTVWLPDIDPDRYAKKGKPVWKLLGFGNLQPGPISLGLEGNPPGAGFAVKGFHPILSKTPVLSEAPKQQDAGAPSALKIQNAPGVDSIARINDHLEEATKPGLNHASLDDGVEIIPLGWIRLPKDIDVSVAWSTRHPLGVVIKNNLPFRDSRLTTMTIKINGATVKARRVAFNTYETRVPLVADLEKLKSLKTSPIDVAVTADGQTKTASLAWANHPHHPPPILVGLEGAVPFWRNFESVDASGGVSLIERRVEIQPSRETSGNVLRVANQDNNHRLSTRFAIPFSLAQNPIMRFRYKASPMCDVSLRLRSNAHAKISENLPDAKPVKWGEPLVGDGAWRVWSGRLTDAYGTHPFQSRIFTPHAIQLGSFSRYDATGKNSVLELDDVVVGPAISNLKNLEVKPIYFSLDSPVMVLHALAPGSVDPSALSEAEADAFPWKDTPNATKLNLEGEKLAEGYHLLLLKAIDAKGRHSTISAIPFLLDVTPLKTSHRFIELKDHRANGSALRLTTQSPKDHAGAPVALRNVTFLFNEKNVRPNSYVSHIIHSADVDHLDLNWPYLLRHFLDDMKDGDKGVLTVSNIADGAGNPSPDVKIPIIIDHAKDKTPPTYLTPHAEHVLWTLDLPTKPDRYAPFRCRRPMKSEFLHALDEEPYLRLSTDGDGGKGDFVIRRLLRKRNKRKPTVSEFPYLALRARLPAAQNEDNNKTPPPEIYLQINFNDRKSLLVSLTDGHALKKNAAKAPVPLKRGDSTWRNIKLDVLKLYEDAFPGKKKDKASEKAPENLKVSQLTILGEKLKKGPFLDLADLTLFDGVTPKSTLRVNAYDQSGVKGFEWRFRDDQEKTIKKGFLDKDAFSFKRLDDKTPPSGWLEFQALDNADNLARAIHFPVIPKNEQPLETPEQATKKVKSEK